MLAFQNHVLIGCRKCQSYECHRRRFWSYFPLGDDVGFVQSIHRKYKASRGNYEGIYQLKILLKLNSGVLGFSLPASSYRGGIFIVLPEGEIPYTITTVEDLTAHGKTNNLLLLV